MRTRFERVAVDALESLEDTLAEQIRDVMEEFVSEYWEEVFNDANINESEVRPHLEAAFERVTRYWSLRQR